MWSLYQQSKLWTTRPSELIAIEDRYVAFCFDEAVAEFGLTIENEMEEASKKAKKEAQAIAARDATLKRLLGLQPKFRDPKEIKKKESKNGIGI